jgi:DNA-binding NtrC family response regulator
MTNISVIDDQDILRDSLTQILTRAGYRVRGFNSAASALESIPKESCDLVITDLKMPGMDGLEMLRKIRQSGCDVPVIMMTAYATVNTAVEAMKLGAYDYIQKPFEADEIELLVKRAIREKMLNTENEALRRTVNDLCQERPLIGQSPVIRKLRDQILKIAPSDATVLIEGESGTGKEMVARAIQQSSSRSGKPMLCLNCAALSENLLESELFGHEKGAFTGADKIRKGRFELADGGTLLLDEISEIPVTLQAKLLRVLQEKQFERVGSSMTRQSDVRVIATTNRDLRAWCKQGNFREDLYYRLSVLPIYIPPLRERCEDIGLLTDYFLTHFASRTGREKIELAPDAKRLLERYEWPGNVRELENLIERACVLACSSRITAELIEPWLVYSSDEKNSFSTRPGRILADTERELILKTLQEFKGHRARTAKALGIGLRTLGLKLKRWQDEGITASMS